MYIKLVKLPYAFASAISIASMYLTATIEPLSQEKLKSALRKVNICYWKRKDLSEADLHSSRMVLRFLDSNIVEIKSCLTSVLLSVLLF
jgi:hypothetical protein